MVEKIEANTLYEYLQHAKKRPILIGSKSISHLNSFITGYQTACMLKGVKETLVPDFGGFHDFVNDYYLHGQSTAGWKNVILAQNYGHEEDAFNDFFRLFELFVEGYPKINSRNIILQIIQRMINDPLCLFPIADDVSQAYLRNLPTKLEEGQSLYEYDSILYDIRKMAANNNTLSSLISDIAGSTEWLRVE